ncbi:MAG: hypothetical protein E7268_03495 [Lachnospiraceae bacterium]|nr:hypothetical protein [Lachnospiraceae bacterium]
MKVLDVCREYCIGCGLCKSELRTEMQRDEKGYWKPNFVATKEEQEFLKEVCPVTGLNSGKLQTKELWGNSVSTLAAYATDAHIRKKASSGGVLTALAIYLLESQKVDGIIQVSVCRENPIETVCRVSTTREDVMTCCGSRYSISSPWMSLSEMVQQGKKYAAIGKPCDIAALRRLKEYDKKYEGISYLLSFFCAGLPSMQANERLLQQLGCKKEQCKILSYRGNGWPGSATAIDSEGNSYEMEYSKAWGGILGRDIHPYCRLCIDGIGEAADISCGDGWYVSADGKQPDFSEKDGRNIVFVRNEVGEELMNEAVHAGVLEALEWDDVSQLDIIQKYQKTRRTTLQTKLVGYRVCGRRTPQYEKALLKEYAKEASVKEKFKMFLGTIKRIIKKII